MDTANQNTEMKQVDETAVFTDEVQIFNPVETELELLRTELDSERDAHLRLAAEFDNYRRRVRQESARAAEEGKRELLERLISLADDLDLALANAGESPDAVTEGLRMIHRQFRAMLEANGVAAFESEGEKFDPERHEAFDVINETNSDAGTVRKEIRRGYFWNGKLLRPALVVVAQ